MTLQRYKLLIEYDGTPFCGWQRQDEDPSVQQTLEEAITAYCGQKVRVFGAGRTDSGVHATGQVAHIDLSGSHNAETLRNALNAHMRPLPVSVIQAEEVTADFDARFSARHRHYCYRILNRRAPPALDKNKVWWIKRELDHHAMQKAATVFIGQHDFTTFRAVQCQAKSPVRHLTRFELVAGGDRLEWHVSARSFLHHQVRSMVGTLKKVGEGFWTADDVRNALEARDRRACGPVAPPDGLYLTRVDYSEDDERAG
jgi:tRNA pseudouridine38-40 synthase